MKKTRNKLLAAFMSVVLAAGLLPVSPAISLAGESADDAGGAVALSPAAATAATTADAAESTAATAADATTDSATAAAPLAAAATQSISTQAAEELSVAIVGAIHDGDTELTVNIAGITSGKYLMVRTFSASATTFRPSYVPYEDDTVIYNKSNPAVGQSTITLKTAAVKDQQIVAFIYDYDDDINVRKLAASSPVSVTEAGSTEPTDPEPSEPTELKRSDLLNGSYVLLTTPNTTGDAAGKFLTTDRNATAAITLHEAVPSATLSVVAWPRTLSFGSDYVDSDDINRFGKRLFTKFGVKSGETVNITFDEATFSSIDDPTAYVIIAYLQFADTTSEDAWPIVKPGARIDIVKDDGTGFEDYTFPDATIDEAELPVGATAMHISLTGDERLFQLARDTKNITSGLQIHVSVVEYDASITPDTYDYEETDQVRLFTMDAYEPFSGKEITFDQPLEEGKRVRALVYTTQYSGDLAPNPIPASHDYKASLPDDSVLVTRTAPPVVMNPTVEITGKLAAGDASFNITVANPPEGALVLVKAYGADETIATQNGTFLASLPAAAGSQQVNLSGKSLSAGQRVVAFLMATGEVKAQSSPATVTGETAQGDVVILGPVDKDDSTVRVVINRDIPSDAHISLRQFDDPVNTSWGSRNSVGSIESPVRGENVVSVSGMKRNYIVAFLATDYGNTIYAASEPMEVTHNAVAPTATIKPADVMFTEGDLYLTLSWSADKYAKNVAYTIYQYEGDTFDAATAETLGTGSISTSLSSAGTFDVSLSGTLHAGCNVCAVVTADDLSATSNPLVVGAKPAWAVEVPSVSFGQESIHASDSSVKVKSLYGEGYEELGSEYFCVVSVYEISPELVAAGYTDEDLEGIPVVAHYKNDTRNDPTRGDLTMTFKDSVHLTEGNYLVIKLRLPDPIRQDKQSMWRDYVSEAIPIVADETGKEDPKDPVVGPGEGGTTEPGESGGDKPGEGGADKPGQGGATTPEKEDPNKGGATTPETPGNGEEGNVNASDSGANNPAANKNVSQDSTQLMPQTGDFGYVVLTILLTLMAALGITCLSQALRNRARVEHAAYASRSASEGTRASKRPTKRQIRH